MLYTVEQIDRMLVSRMEALARHLAPRGEKRGHRWVALNPARGDRKLGSFSINLATGYWGDFASGDGAKTLPGLGLVAYLATRGDFHAAIIWAKDWLGLTGKDADPVVARRLDSEVKRAQGQEKDARLRRRNAAFAIFLNAVKLTGDCPASLYLQGRGLDPKAMEGGRFPRCLRFHAGITHPHIPGKFPALIVCQSLETLPRGFAGIHRIYLAKTEDGRWVKAFGKKDSKCVLGYEMGASIRICKGASGKPLAQAEGEFVLVTEGVEDALALMIAYPGKRVLAAYSLAAIGNLILPETIAGVTVVADNDTGNQAAEAALEAACLKLCDRHRDVRVARLPPEFKDVNDCLIGKRSA